MHGGSIKIAVHKTINNYAVSSYLPWVGRTFSWYTQENANFFVHEFILCMLKDLSSGLDLQNLLFLVLILLL